MSGFLFNSKYSNWFHDFFNLSLLFLFNGFTSDTAAAYPQYQLVIIFLLHFIISTSGYLDDFYLFIYLTLRGPKIVFVFTPILDKALAIATPVYHLIR